MKLIPTTNLELVARNRIEPPFFSIIEAQELLLDALRGHMGISGGGSGGGEVAVVMAARPVALDLQRTSW